MKAPIQSGAIGTKGLTFKTSCDSSVAIAPATGEYHDHKGKWKGDMIVFEPLVYMSAGKKCTETFSLSFPSIATFALNSVTETTAGLSTITGRAKKH
jgi:hypothetical protein